MAARKSVRKAAKRSAKTSAAKKGAAKKSGVKKSAAKKSAAKKSATKKSATKKSAARKGSAKTSGRTSVHRGGKPVEETAARSRARSTRDVTPSSAELDLRDRLKAGPRRPAGPPLVGDIMTRDAMESLRAEVLPKPTDPKDAPGGD